MTNTPQTRTNNHPVGESTSVEALTRRIEELEACRHLVTAAPQDNAIADALLDTMNGVKAGINQLAAQQMQLMQYTAIHGLVPAGPFLTRFHTDHPEQKRSLAEHVADAFFTQRRVSQRCFIQASSAALHLAQALDGIPTVPDRCLIYTNSAVAHLPMLYGHSNSKHTVWPFCGHTFDPVCAGWLIPAGDDKSFEELERLFTRDDAPLKTAFLFPLYLSPRDGFFYERADAAQFANALSRAEEVVVLGTGNRVVPSRDRLPTEPSHKKFFPALQQLIAENARKIKVVISWPSEPLPEVASEFASIYGSVHWETPEGWKVLEPAPA